MRLRRRVALRDALLAAFAGAMRSARRCALEAREDPRTAVHEYRKSIRRARSVVALLRPALGRKATDGLVEELRHALRETSALRDDDVLAATLSGVAGDDPALFVEAAELAARMGDHAGRRPVPEEVLKGTLPILRRLAPTLEVVLPRGYSTPDLEQGLARTYRRMHQTLERAVHSKDDADFHQWRKRVKELRYQLELLASIGSPQLKAREKVLGELARELGEVTDLAVMCRRVQGEHGEGRLLERARALLRERADLLLERGRVGFTQAPGTFALEVLAERG